MEQTNGDIQVIIKNSVLGLHTRVSAQWCWLGFLSIIISLSLLCFLNKVSYSLPLFSLKFCTPLKPVASEVSLHLNLSYRKEWKGTQVQYKGSLINTQHPVCYALSPGANANPKQISVDKFLPQTVTVVLWRIGIGNLVASLCVTSQLFCWHNKSIFWLFCSKT